MNDFLKYANIFLKLRELFLKKCMNIFLNGVTTFFNMMRHFLNYIWTISKYTMYTLMQGILHYKMIFFKSWWFTFLKHTMNKFNKRWKFLKYTTSISWKHDEHFKSTTILLRNSEHFFKIHHEYFPKFMMTIFEIHDAICKYTMNNFDAWHFLIHNEAFWKWWWIFWIHNEQFI